MAVALVLLFLTSVFELMPMCIIGAIIISGVMSLVDYPEAIRLWRFDLFDFCVWLVTFLGVFFLGAELGLLCGVVLSFVQVLAQSALPRIRILGRLPGTNAYRSVAQYPEAESYPGCLVVSTDAPLFFLNAQSVKDKVVRRAAELDAETGVFTRFIVLDLTSVPDVDTCALHELDDWLSELASGEGNPATVSSFDNHHGGPPSSVCGLRRRRQLLLANPNSAVMGRMDGWGFIDRLGRGRCFAGVHDAVTWALAELEDDEDGDFEQRQDRGESDETDFRIGEATRAADGTEGVEMPPVGARLSPQADFSILEDGLHHRRASSPSEASLSVASTPATARPASRAPMPPHSGQGPWAWFGR
jgi:sulfate transporter 4